MRTFAGSLPPTASDLSESESGPFQMADIAGFDRSPQDESGGRIRRQGQMRTADKLAGGSGGEADKLSDKANEALKANKTPRFREFEKTARLQRHEVEAFLTRILVYTLFPAPMEAHGSRSRAAACLCWTSSVFFEVSRFFVTHQRVPLHWISHLLADLLRRGTLRAPAALRPTQHPPKLLPSDFVMSGGECSTTPAASGVMVSFDLDVYRLELRMLADMYGLSIAMDPGPGVPTEEEQQTDQQQNTGLEQFLDDDEQSASDIADVIRTTAEAQADVLTKQGPGRIQSYMIKFRKPLKPLIQLEVPWFDACLGLAFVSVDGPVVTRDWKNQKFVRRLLDERRGRTETKISLVQLMTVFELDSHGPERLDVRFRMRAVDFESLGRCTVDVGTSSKTTGDIYVVVFNCRTWDVVTEPVRLSAARVEDSSEGESGDESSRGSELEARKRGALKSLGQRQRGPVKPNAADEKM